MKNRTIPARFFYDIDVASLSKKMHQLILIGLIQAADEQGRGVAHAGLLNREIDISAEEIEEALTDLEANGLLQLYTDERHRYFYLTRWSEWRPAGRSKTPSLYPAPPEQEQSKSLPCEDEQAIVGAQEVLQGYELFSLPLSEEEHVNAGAQEVLREIDEGESGMMNDLPIEVQAQEEAHSASATEEEEHAVSVLSQSKADRLSASPKRLNRKRSRKKKRPQIVKHTAVS